MYNRPLVSADFNVPARLECGDYILRMLSIDDVDMDYEAVMASAERVKGLLDPDSPWPDGLTKKEDLVDLGWHQREFTLRHSFAYTVMATSGDRCLGCCYIFPSCVLSYDAAVFYWVREGADAETRDAHLGAALRAWLREDWPFSKIGFPGRDIPWSVWRSELT